MFKKTQGVLAATAALVLLLSVVLTGCGGSANVDPSDPIIGTWTLTSAEADGISMNMGGDSMLDASLDIRADGTIAGESMGLNSEGTWKKDGTGYTLTMDGEDVAATLENDTLTFETDGVVMTMEKN